MEVGIDSIRVRGHHGLKAVDIQTLPYPGFVPIYNNHLTTLLTQTEGQSGVRETIYAERFKHVQELHRMGANIHLSLPHKPCHLDQRNSRVIPGHCDGFTLWGLH